MKVFGFMGKKQSGKNTCCNIIHGMVMKKLGLIPDYKIAKTGDLIILNDGVWSGFDVSRRDPAFVEYADETFWPYVKSYSFAEMIKFIGENLFDIPYECLHGSSEQKNTLQEHLLWENMPGQAMYNMTKMAGNLGVKEGAMTAREFMQFFGTEIMRKMWEPVWTQHVMKKILSDNSEIALISDVRFINEAEAIIGLPGNVIVTGPLVVLTPIFSPSSAV